MSPSRMQFDFALGRGSAPRRADEEPLRLLVLADLGGSHRAALAQRRPQAVDVDTLEAVFARIAPALQIELDGVSLPVPFASLDDFHPDRLMARLAPFDALRKLRVELNDPAQFRRAAAAFQAPGGLAGAGDAAQPAPAAATAAADVERLLGRKPSAAVAAGPGGDVLQAWLHRVVAPHVVPSIEHEQRALLAGLDEALGVLMRRVLHHPQVQALEAAWRGMERLVRELELGDTLLLHVLDVSRAELQADVAAHRADLSASALHAQLCGRGGPDGQPWGLLVVDQAFGPGPDEMQLLAALGALAGRAGAPLLAAATPQLAGADDVAALAEPHRWDAQDTDDLAHWAALRGTPMAEWIGLAAPRVLLRLPYGAATDRIESFAFEEMPGPRQHEAYLWGNGAWALALLVGRAFLEQGWALDLSTQLDLQDLPSHIVREDGQSQQQPCAELLLGEPAAQALLARGLMPLVSRRDRNAVRLWCWQSVAHPARALAGLGTAD